MSHHCPEKGATFGLDQTPSCNVAIMIVIAPSLWVKNTVLPSDVKAGAESSPAGQTVSGWKSTGARAVLVVDPGDACWAIDRAGIKPSTRNVPAKTTIGRKSSLDMRDAMRTTILIPR